MGKKQEASGKELALANAAPGAGSKSVVEKPERIPGPGYKWGRTRCVAGCVQQRHGGPAVWLRLWV